MPKLLRSPQGCLLLLCLSPSLFAGCTTAVLVNDSTTGANAGNPDAGGAGASSTQDASKQGSSLTQEGDATSEPGQESPTQEKGEESADKGSSSSSSSDAGDDQNKEELCTEAGNDRHCAPVAPPKWSGPIALAQARDAKGVRVCNAHGVEVEELFDKVTGAAAECTGCTARLSLPNHGVAQLVEFQNDGCSRDYIVRRLELNPDECVPVPSWSGSGREPYWGFRFGPRMGKLTCRASNPKPVLPKVEKASFFRGCQIEQKGRCESPDETCVRKSDAPTCVYRVGSHDCPAPYNDKRTILYTGIDDTRGCSECKKEFKKGTLEPRGRVGFYESSSCTYLMREEISLERLVGHCRSDARRIESGWLYVKSEPRESVFMGSCKGVGWKPKGSVKEKNPTTLCCTSID